MQMSLNEMAVRDSATEETIRDGFRAVVRMTKAKGNRVLYASEVPEEIRPLLPLMERNGWVKLEGAWVKVRDDLKDHHKPEDIVELFRLDCEGKPFDEMTALKTHYCLNYTGPGIRKAVEAAWEELGEMMGMSGVSYKPLIRNKWHEAIPGPELQELIDRLCQAKAPDEVRVILSHPHTIRYQHQREVELTLTPDPVVRGLIALTTDRRRIKELLSYCSPMLAPVSMGVAV